jgi:hypothetical protein
VFVYGKAGFLAHAFQEGGQIAALELDDGTALATVQMVAMAVIGCRVTMTSILGVDPARKAHVDQQVERAIDGHQADGGAVQPGSLANGGWSRVATILQERPDYRPPGQRNPVASLAQLVDNSFLR